MCLQQEQINICSCFFMHFAALLPACPKTIDNVVPHGIKYYINNELSAP